VSVRQKQGSAKKYNPDGWRFFSRPERLRPCFCLRTRTTFAPEIKTKAYRVFDKKKKGSNWDTADKQQSGRKAVSTEVEFQKIVPETKKSCRSNGINILSDSYFVTAKKI